MYTPKMHTHRSVTAFLLGVVVLLGGTSVLADMVVIVHPDSGVAALSIGDVKNLFLRKSKTLAGSTIAIPVDQKQGSKNRTTFMEKVLGKSKSQLKAYWSKLIFSGKGSPPKTLDDDAAVKSFVAGTAGAIGYIDSSWVDGTVQVVLNVKSR